MILKKISILIFCSFLIFSCKTKKALVSEIKATEKVTSKEIIANHYKNKTDFKTLYIKSDIGYEDAKQRQNVTAEIKIKKDEMILVSVRFLGITMAKALITPTEVKYYEKLNGKFFEGNYQLLSNWLGTDLDFQKIQNLLIGNTLDDLKNGKYLAKIENDLYQLSSNENGINKEFYFEASNFLLKKQTMSQMAENRNLEINYIDHKQYPEAILPTNFLIEALSDKGKTTIEAEYKSVIFNEDLSFPYSVPDSYKQIFIH
jgi:hypothetical protein